jgi:predicted hotdog family 3-hydroxylacyl-ACP dehydratase
MAHSESVIDPALIPKLIPQAFPMIMVDDLLAYSNELITAALTVKAENIFSQAGRLTAPGVIEHMAQTIALYTGYQYFLRNEPAPTGYIGAIKSVEISELPLIGETLKTTVTVLHEIMGVTLVKVSTLCNGKEIATSEMKTVIAT